MNTSSHFSELNGTLKRSFDEVIGAAEDLLRATVDETSAEYRKARKALDANVRAAKSQMSDHAGEFVSEARELGAKGNRFVHANPWPSIGVGAAIGLLVGIFLRNR